MFITMLLTPHMSLIDDAIEALTTLGVLPVILVAAVIGLASILYRRFRR